MNVSYFSIEELVLLEILSNKNTGKITSLTMYYYPRYQTVKGQVATKTLDYIILDTESYIVKIKKVN